MAGTIRYTLSKPSRLLYSSITEKSAPIGVAGTVTPKFSGTFGVEEDDLKAMIEIQVRAISAETGGFTSPVDYYLACMSGVTAAKRVRQAAEFKAAKPGLSSDDVFKIKEKAEKRATLYEPYAGILSASSQFDIELAKLDSGKIVDIGIEPHARAQAGKDQFYSGAYVVPAVAFKACRRKKVDDKDGATAYLQNVLFIRKGEKLAGSGPANTEVFGGYAGYSDYDPLTNAPSNEDVTAGEAQW